MLYVIGAKAFGVTSGFERSACCPTSRNFMGTFSIPTKVCTENVRRDTSILSVKFSDMSLSAALEPKHMPVSVGIPLTSVKTTELW